jgi:hypothetical protein
MGEIHAYVPKLNFTSLGDDIDSINNPREVPENGEQQTDPELHLMDDDESPQIKLTN